MTSKTRPTDEQVVDSWCEELDPAFKATSDVRVAEAANRSSQTSPAQRDRTAEQSVERWFEEVARQRPAGKAALEVPPSVSAADRGVATSPARRDPVAEQAPERWFEGLVDRWFGEVDGSFEQLAGPLSADRRKARQSDVPRAVRPPAAQRVIADVVASALSRTSEPNIMPGSSRTSEAPTVASSFSRTSEERTVASGFPPPPKAPARLAEAREGFSRTSDDPASTVAQYCGKLEGFNAELRLLGPRIRRADLLLRIFNRRDPVIIF